MNANGNSKYLMWAGSLVLAGLTAYFTSQIAITGELKDRPTRVETDKEHEKMGQAYGKRVDELKETVRRELDDVKNSQNRAHDALRDLSRDVNRFMRRQEARDKDR